MNSKGNVLIIGPSGSGKTTISNKIMQWSGNHKLFIADTSREIRVGERNGYYYNFVDSETISQRGQKNGKYLVESYYGNYYGYDLTSNDIEKNVIMSPGVIVADKIIEAKHDFNFTVSILLTINKSTFRTRLRNRGETNDQIRKRGKSFETLDLSSKVDFILDGNLGINELDKELRGIIRQL